MKRIIPAIILGITAITAQAGIYGDVARRQVKTAQLIYDHCSAGPRDPMYADFPKGCYDIQKMRQVCLHFKVGRSASAQDGNKELYATLDRTVNHFCGTNE